jgi:uncharacterized protein (TIGR03083 family)
MASGNEGTQREIAAELGEFADLLASLAPEQWDVPSLCERWHVRQVAGHIVASYDPKLTVWRGMFGAVRHGFDFDALIDANARAHEAGRSPEELVDAVRTVDLGQGVATFVTAPRRLLEHVVHHQDVRRPLARPRTMPEHRLRAVLDAAYAPRGPKKPPPKWARGLTFAATDVDWRQGAGPVVEGPGEALLLALSRRPAVLPELSGDGLAGFTQQLA